MRLVAVSKLSQPVQDFLRERIDALEQLEVLLLVCTQPALRWDAEVVAEALKLEVEQARAALSHLHENGLIAVDETHPGAYRFAPGSETLAAHASATSEAYSHARVEVLMFVSRCAMDRIRTAQLRTFAQAFLLRDPTKKDRR